MSDKTLVLKGVAWSGVQMIVNQFFAFAVRLILAGVLLPSEFGIVGMATVFTGLIQVINDLGISAMLVQKKQEDLREDHFHTAFWIGVVWSVLLYAIMALLIAPMAVSFYNQPVLDRLIPVMSISILLAPANAIVKAVLTKNMNFKKIAFAENTASGLSGVLALAMAWQGYGLWALALQPVFTVVFATTIYMITARWRPRFVWSKAAFHDIFGFGAYTTGTNITNYVMNNFDYFLIGKLVSASALGAYTFAFMITDTFRGKLMTIINNVMYPMYGRKQDDKAALKKYYLKVVQYNSLIVFPVMLVIILCGDDIVYLFFGNKWDAAIFPMQILSLAAMVHMMVNSNTALIRGMGKPGLEMKLQVFKALIFIPILWIGIAKYGIAGAAGAVLIHKIISVLIAQYAFHRYLNLNIRFMDLVRYVSISWLSCIVALVLILVFRYLANDNLWMEIFLIGVSYLGMVYWHLGEELLGLYKSSKASSNRRVDKVSENVK